MRMTREPFSNTKCERRNMEKTATKAIYRRFNGHSHTHNTYTQHFRNNFYVEKVRGITAHSVCPSNFYVAHQLLYTLECDKQKKKYIKRIRFDKSNLMNRHNKTMLTVQRLLGTRIKPSNNNKNNGHIPYIGYIIFDLIQLAQNGSPFSVVCVCLPTLLFPKN